jgi:Lon protease-like protein
LSRVLEIADELGADVTDMDLTLSEDPTAAMYDIAHVAPLQEMDQQRILEEDDATRAAEILRDELTGLIEMMEFERTVD